MVLKILKIYKLSNDSNNLIYYGSTSCSIAQRMAIHRYGYKKWCESIGKYCSSFEVFKNNSNVKIELVEVVENKADLHTRERFYTDSNECVNLRNPTRTPADVKLNNEKYYGEHKLEISEQKKQYYQANKEQILNKMKLIYKLKKQTNKQNDLNDIII